MTHKRITLILTSIMCVFVAIGGEKEKEILPPFDFKLFLSGNFGELRSNHFHAGLDFKTQGATGKAIICPADGCIIRATVSAGGYGRAIYVLHENGYMTVYGHLEKFPAEVAQIVRNHQYENETFAVDIKFPPGKFPIQRGEVLAYSGNSGYSFGPHLHFEIRTSDGNQLINPLSFYKSQITDTKAPRAYAVATTPAVGEGIVNGNTRTVISKIAGNSLADTLDAWGKIGFAIKGEDIMNDTHNKYGIYAIELYIDDSLRFSSRMDRYSHAETRLINAWVNYALYADGKGRFQRSYILDNNPLRLLHSDAARGWLMVDEERIYNVEYRLSDIHGNSNSYKFAIKGKYDTIPQRANAENKDTHYLYWFLNNEISYDGMRLFIPRGELFENATIDIETQNDTPLSRIYILNGKEYPLRRHATLTLQLPDTLQYAPKKYHITKKTQKGWTSVGGEVSDGKITTDISLFGTYKIAIDTISPKVTPISKKANSIIQFKISDSGTGIKSHKGFIDNKFVLFEFSSKNGLLTCDLQREEITRGTHTLHLIVTDHAGNETTINKTIIH